MGPSNAGHDLLRRLPGPAALLLSAAIVAGALLGKLHANQTGEYFNIARALAGGEGFVNAIGAPTGPTAWMPPLLPALLAGLLRAGGPRAVDVVLVPLHVAVLIGTGFLVLALARRTTRHVGAGAAAVLFFLGLLFHFRYWFERANECWLILLCLDGLLAGLCLLRPLDRWPTAAGWGVFGGLCAQANPVIGLAWGVLSLAHGLRRRACGRPALAVLCAGLALAPWTLRNYRVFGRLIPVKSNLAYELYQSQCLQPDGLLQLETIRLHPSSQASPRERREFQQLGETAYLDRKWQEFARAVRADPVDFLDRVAGRFLGATLWYVPFDRKAEASRPWLLWLKRLTHPLPFLAFVFLLGTAVREPLSWTQGAVLGVYVLYLLPYIAASYYDRYAAPLVAVQALLVLWALDRAWAWRTRSRPERASGDAGPPPAAAAARRRGEWGSIGFPGEGMTDRSPQTAYAG
jgi:hypothetical protein